MRRRRRNLCRVQRVSRERVECRYRFRSKIYTLPYTHTTDDLTQNLGDFSPSSSPIFWRNSFIFTKRWSSSVGVG